MKMKFPTIICDVCNKPCDKLAVHDDLETGDIVMRAFCHGDVDTMRLSHRDMVTLGPEALDQMNHGTGHAFTAARIQSAI